MWPSDDSDTTGAKGDGNDSASGQLPTPPEEQPKQASLANQETVWVRHPKGEGEASPEREESQASEQTVNVEARRQPSEQTVNVQASQQQTPKPPPSEQTVHVQAPKQQQPPSEQTVHVQAPRQQQPKPPPSEQTVQVRRPPQPPEPSAAEQTQIVPLQPIAPPPQQQYQQQQQMPWQNTPPPQPIPPAGNMVAQPMRIEPSGEVHPVEAPSEEQPPPEAPDAPPKTGRKRRGLVFGGVAVVLVIAVGVALAVPYVSNRLGLPWAPNVPKGDEPEPAAVTLSLQPPSDSAPTPSSSGVNSALSGPASNPALGTVAGTVIDPATGSTLWNHNATQLLTPASATKLLISAAALLKLDHAMQLTTKVVQGASPDTAIIVAGGDPTLSSLPAGKDSVYPGAAHLDDLVAQVKAASGGKITKVQIDLSMYTGPTSAQGWAPDDAPSISAAPVVPAMLDGGRQDPTVDYSMRSANPALSLLQEFSSRLGASVAPTTTATATQGAKVLGEVKSAPLTELINNLLSISDDNLAEAVARQLAIGAGAPASFEGGAQTALNVLAQNGFDTSGAVLNDGSGLSTLNKVSPKLLAQLLSVAAAPTGKDPRTEKLRPLLEGLPVAGGSGTLSDRFDAPNAKDGRGWVRAKTGTLSGVNTLAGVVLDKDGRVLVFAVMSNGSDANSARPALDAVAATLRGCGCG
ncbi:D-alanyl-D-alanine carboxypeptidase/D-alanyl-D-alanine-endopeptidase [Amycolatopsis acidicola]|uniref:D-alanyl-D-alanine carboxypeptidase/D-alanyl-D-alanine-endopeptidase n=2 Tax=Amycolatopsis acidicola TaxID=2596893 RepID=A0A5N0UW12_9PSEU|nr:D-alanyl-D-alanine carboxypeptidase/D-alanyl-D-alanine-endopeptidase [Amycolatopsis acidicola]KAA9154960.1 D-alanyl-D-alanine carboxypeptidase/D-alanyl-D-alanine-endopeptidase [Amycolatopsis acidicola]